MKPSSVMTFDSIVHMLAQTCESLLFFDMGCQFAFSIYHDKEKDYSLAFMNITFTIIARTVATIV